MVGLKPELSFTPAVQQAFGTNHVLIVKDAYSGQSIRSWCMENHEDPPPTVGRVPKVRGEHYVTLMKKVDAAVKGQTIQSMTFVWMQGESDIRNPAYDVYLQKLMEQLHADLKSKEINLVIGRISDCGLDQQKRLKGKLFIRKTQQAFAETYPRGTWIDTDDLNDKLKDGKIINDLHYTPEGSIILGKRFAKAAITLINTP